MIRNKTLCVIFFLSIFLQSVFSASVPDWLKKTDEVYPHDEFIYALGEGNSERKAQNNAIAQIALQFNTKVKVVNTAISDLHSSQENDKSSYSKMDEFHQDLTTVSEAEFYCLKFTSTYFEKKQKKYYVLAYINRAEAFEIYLSKILPLKKEIDFLMQNAKTESEPLYKVLLYHRAAIMGEIVKVYIANATTIYPKKANSFDDILTLIEDINSLNTKQTNKITFSVNCDNPKGKNLIPGLSSILEASGFVYTTKNPVYHIHISVSFNEESYEAGEFVRPSILITVQNKDGNTIDSYSKIYPRYTHGTIENSYNLAVLRVQRDLEENFMSNYRFINMDE